MSSAPDNHRHNHIHTHSSLNATRDYMHASDHGELMNPQQSKTFVVDPLLIPVTVTSQPHPILPDPSPSDNPDMFDKSTRHPNTHYHPEAKLSKKKRAKKLGIGSIASRPHTQYAGGRPFTEHEKDHHERAERRDSQLGQSEEEYSEYSEDENHTEEQTSHAQHAENRITGTEKKAAAVPPAVKPNAMRGQKAEGVKGDEDEGEADKGEGDKSEKEEGASLREKATGLLSSAQAKASELASGAVDAVRGAPVVGSLLNKVGLGGGQNKSKNSTTEGMAQAKKEETA